MALIGPEKATRKLIQMVLTDLSYSALKAYQRQHRDHFPENLSLRVHRALSWLSKAEQARANKDTDTEFIYYWICFNAAYANEFGEIDRIGEKELFEAFLSKKKMPVIY